jgi:uncharacterized protein (DUF2235 family)
MKRIVVLIDGARNKEGTTDDTNVARLDSQIELTGSHRTWFSSAFPTNSALAARSRIMRRTRGGRFCSTCINKATSVRKIIRSK